MHSISNELKAHQNEHKVIDQFHSKVLQAERSQPSFTGDESILYQQSLNQLKKVYAELLSLSNKRLSDLDALHDFVNSATSEINWYSEHERVEMNRDWSDVNMEVNSLNDFYKGLVSEFNSREYQHNIVLEKGDGLLIQHPATKIISSFLKEMQIQRSWLYQLIHCFEVHFKNLAEYQHFFDEVKENKAWLAQRTDLLESTFSDSNFDLDQGDNLLRGMQNVREELNQFAESIEVLNKKSKSIVPLRERRQLTRSGISIKCLVNFKDSAVSLEQGDQCKLIDITGRTKWRVQTSKGKEVLIPSVCLQIPPPNNEATEAIEKLKFSLSKATELWQSRQIRLRQNMIFATIKVVKAWDFAQFVAMGYEQRTAIRRALNDDADKVLYESDPADHQLRRLRQEMQDVNRLFDEFEKRANVHGMLILFNN